MRENRLFKARELVLGWSSSQGPLLDVKHCRDVTSFSDCLKLNVGDKKPRGPPFLEPPFVRPFQTSTTIATTTTTIVSFRYFPSSSFSLSSLSFVYIQFLFLHLLSFFLAFFLFSFSNYLPGQHYETFRSF